MYYPTKKQCLWAVALAFVGIGGFLSDLHAELIRELSITGFENVSITPKSGASGYILSNLNPGGHLMESNSSTVTASGFEQSHSMSGKITDLVTFSDPAVIPSSMTSVVTFSVTIYADELTRWFVYKPGGPAMLYTGQRKISAFQQFSNGQKRQLFVTGTVAYSAFGTSTLDFRLPSHPSRPV